MKSGSNQRKRPPDLGELSCINGLIGGEDVQKTFGGRPSRRKTRLATVTREQLAAERKGKR